MFLMGFIILVIDYTTVTIIVITIIVITIIILKHLTLITSIYHY